MSIHSTRKRLFTISAVPARRPARPTGPTAPTTLLSAATSSLFASSSPVAPVCYTKPPPDPEKDKVITNKPENIYILPSHHNTQSNEPVSPAESPRVKSPEVLPPSPVEEDGELSEEVLIDLAQIEDVWNHCMESDQEAVSPSKCSCHSLPRGSCPKFKADFISQIVSCRAFPLPNMDGAKLPLLYPSFDADVWEASLGSYFDAREIVDAIRYGWDISFSEQPNPKDAWRNNSSAMQFPEHVWHYVEKELQFGSLVGPFKPEDLPFKFFRSPFGSVLKKLSKWRRTVTDCSQLEAGINAFINPRYHRGAPWKLTLPNSMSIVRAIMRTRAMYPTERIYMWKSDMSRWYRWLLLDPAAAPYFAVQWEGRVYLDAALSFGNRGSALAAQRFVWAVVWIFRTQLSHTQGGSNSGLHCSCRSHCDCGCNCALCYIDDILGFSPSHLADFHFNSFLALAKHLGLRLSTTEGHVSPPGPVCTALGLEYNLDANTISLPKDKVVALSDLLREWLDKPKASQKELASLAGKLLNASNVLFVGRLFVNRVLATKRRAAKFSHKIYLEESFRDDIQWWLEAIQVRNGVSFLVQDATVEISLDASSNGWANGAPGIGAYHHGLHEYISVSPPPELHDLHISDLELLGHLLVARVWGSQMAHQHARILTDSECCFFLIKNGRSAHDNRLRMARLYASHQIEHDYRAEPVWLSTTDNWLADALTRTGSEKHRIIFENHCKSIGVTPKQRHISPEMFLF